MSSEHEVWTIVVAAGSGERFGADKLSEHLAGSSTVLDVAVARASAQSVGAVVVLRDDDPMLDAPPEPGILCVAGGDTRSASARAGLAAVPDSATIVLIHDAARPLADEELFGRVIDAVAGGASAVVPVVPIVDTVRATSGEVVDRDSLRAVQTPQGFAAAALREAHASGAVATDDASLVEAIGYQVVLVDGDVRNLKITKPADIEVARALLANG